MEIFEVSATFFTELIPAPYQIFGSATFNKLNMDKCDKLFYLLFKDSKYRLGLIGGIKNNDFYSPFSAPFGGFSFLSADIRLQALEQALSLLLNWATEKQFGSIKITLPPSIYNESFIAKQTNGVFRKDFKIDKIDLNYSFRIDDFDNNYPNHIWYNARKNLKIAQNSRLSFVKCASDMEKNLAYEVIQKNRISRGFPLRMTWEQVTESTAVIPADFFILNNEQHDHVASAIIFHINQDVVQVIYWGDLPEFAGLKPMNFLSFKVFEYYRSLRKKVVDIGPSTDNSLPNYGLCEFKESIGCEITSKLSFIKYLIS